MSVSPVAVVLAAGRGVRLSPRTEHQPKPLTTVHGIGIIDNLMAALDNTPLRDIVIVTGHLSGVLENHVRALAPRCALHFVHNERFASTNNIYSLWLARDYLENGLLLFEADVFFEHGLVRALFDSPYEDTILVDRFRPPMNGTVVNLHHDGYASEMYLGSEQSGLDVSLLHKTVNFYRFGSEYTRNVLLPGLDRHIARGNVNSYYELIVKESICSGTRLHCLEATPYRWWEIDTEDDLRMAEDMFGQR
jgi:L-glutamine-phosphate cytidylyltransferase